MQPVFDCNQSFRISNNNTIKKIKILSFYPNNKTDKTNKFSEFILEKNRKNKKLPKN